MDPNNKLPKHKIIEIQKNTEDIKTYLNILDNVKSDQFSLDDNYNSLNISKISFNSSDLTIR